MSDRTSSGRPQRSGPHALQVLGARGGVAHDAGQQSVGFRPRRRHRGCPRVTEIPFQGPQQRGAHGMVVRVGDAIAGVTAPEILDLRYQHAEIVQATDGEGQRLQQLLALRGHVGRME